MDGEKTTIVRRIVVMCNSCYDKFWQLREIPEQCSDCDQCRDEMSMGCPACDAPGTALEEAGLVEAPWSKEGAYEETMLYTCKRCGHEVV